ncbi:hypothetical protein BDN70DRAFT_884041 [Pholiota conissans]|uniref:Uncharacterized protein n=1 Tax=Pholiota conissans TaxID=109636 RepID=A0A9P5YWF1_9AGAR|nr:hypothetical protein BDN70DRAFT_884041 [Pholiota conissans]
MSQPLGALSLGIYALIIEQVATNWCLKSALKALSLTHRSFVPLCQKYIFSSITIPCSSPKVDTFPDILQASPHLFDNVKSFTYDLDDTDPPAPVKARRNDNTVQLLERLQGLDALTISTPEPYEVRWNLIDARITDALLRLIHSLSLRSLHLERIRNFPKNALLQLSNSPNIKSISVSAVGIEDTAGALAPLTTIWPQLSKVSAYPRSAEAVSALVAGISPSNPSVAQFPHLREIFTEWEDDKDMNASHQLIGSASQLDDLFCSLSKNSMATFEGLAASILKGSSQTLRVVKLYTTEPDEDVDEPFLKSIPELQQLAGGKMKVLERIDMNFNLFLGDSDYSPKNLWKSISAQSKSLDDIFADRNAFPALRSISIYFIVSIFDDSGYENFTLVRQFHAVSKLIREKLFRNLDGIPTINLSFRLEMEWTDE